MANLHVCQLVGTSRSTLLLLLAGLSIALLLVQPAAAARNPKKLEFYMVIVVQNNSFLDNPSAQFTAVQSAQPLQAQPFAFGNIHTFDNPLTTAPSLNSTHLGRVQGWYGNAGQDVLTLFLAQTFTYDDDKHNGTFSLLGVDVANAAIKFAPIVGGTGDFAYARGVAQQSLVSTTIVNSEIVSWFRYLIHFTY